jgi:predicted transcriptional regulator
MPYFTHGETKYKLIVLYIVSHAGPMITSDQLYRTAVLNSSMDWFAFQNVVNELEEDGMLACVRKLYGDCYGITDSGRDALDMFEKTVPADERRKLDAYLADNRDLFARETQLSSRIEQQPDGSFTLHLYVAERDRVVFSVSLDTASEEQAIEMRSHWDECSESIYNFVWDVLLNRQTQK